jgi:hypothetical protein
VQAARKIPAKPELTIREFLRAIAGLGGNLGRKCDGDPGWITLLARLRKTHVLARGADAQN